MFNGEWHGTILLFGYFSDGTNKEWFHFEI